MVPAPTNRMVLMVLLLIRQVLIIPLMVLVILLLIIPLMVLIIRAGAGHPPDGSNPAKQNRTSRPDDQDGSGSGFIN